MRCSLLTNHVCVHTTGEYRLCCISQEPSKDQNIRNTTPQEWTDGSYVQNITKQFERGQWPLACEKCRLLEQAGETSKRLQSNSLYSGTGIKFVDIRLGNTCNLRCQTCWPVSSSRIAADMISFNKQSIASPWDSMIPIDFETNSNWQENIALLDSLINVGLEEIYITGGEPFLVKNLDRILNQLSPNTRIRFNTNGTIYNKETLKILDKFDSVQIDISVDAYGSKNDYIRVDSVWDTVEKNIKKFASRYQVNITPTVSVYNILYLDELIKFCSSINIKCVTNPLVSPSFMSISNAPAEMKLEIKGFKFLTDIPTKKLEQRAFINFVRKTDMLRNISISDSLPEVANYYGIN